MAGTIVSSKPSSIVVVEDDVGMSKALERLLRAAGFRPQSFTSAEALLRTDAAAQADCFVLDVNLPGISGLELARCLITEGRGRAIIFITGLDDAKLRDEVRGIGCLCFLKPFDGKALLGAIRNSIDVN